MNDFIGRKYELQQLEELYRARQSKIAVVYGRRRIGKSTLIEEFAKGKNVLRFEGLEGENTPEQLKQFTLDLEKQIPDSILKNVKFTSWDEVFNYLSTRLSATKTRTIVFIDEYQWLAVQQSKLTRLLKKHWDQSLSKCNIMLILCGSISSYMIHKVINSTALYGRIDYECSLGPLSPIEIHELLSFKRSPNEALKYCMLIGGVPKYLELIKTNRSFEQNINELCFTKAGYLVNDYRKIFYSQFREHMTYEKIIKHFKSRPFSLEEAAEQLEVASGGGMKFYLDNLTEAGFLTCFSPYQKASNSRLKRYQLADEYLRFYFKYIGPNLSRISRNSDKNLFQILTLKGFDAWMGLCFEAFCLRNADALAEIMGFSDYVTNFGPYFERQDTGFQIDLLYKRTDKVITLCELKYSDAPVAADVIATV